MIRIQILLLWVAALLLTGCATTPQPVANEYLLPGKKSDPVQLSDAGIKAICIYPVRVADFLAGDRMILVEESGQVHRTRNHLWAEPLPKQLTRITRNQINSQVQGINCYETTVPAEKDCSTLMIRVDAFQVTKSGQTEIRGYWKISSSNGDLLLKKTFDQKHPLPDSGYPAMVQALNRGWSKVVDELAEKISRLPATKVP